MNPFGSSPALSPGARLAAYWMDCGDRCLSSIYRFYTDAHGPEMQLVIQSAIDDDLVIGPELFGSTAQGNLLRVLVGCHAAGLSVTTRNILALARQLGWPIVDAGGDEAACLRCVLECESSAAGLTTWPIYLRDCKLRRRITRELSVVYARTLDPTDAVQDIIALLAASIDAWRAEAQGVRHAA